MLIWLWLSLITLITVSKDTLFYLRQLQQGVFWRQNIMSKKNLFNCSILALCIFSLFSHIYGNTGIAIWQFIMVNIICMILFVDRLPLWIAYRQQTLKQPQRTPSYRRIATILLSIIISWSLYVGRSTSTIISMNSVYDFSSLVSLILFSILSIHIILPLILYIISFFMRSKLLPSLITQDTLTDQTSDVKILSITWESGRYVFILEHEGKEYDFRTDAKDEEILKRLAAEIISHLDNGVAYEILYEHSKRIM